MQGNSGIHMAPESVGQRSFLAVGVGPGKVVLALLYAMVFTLAPSEGLKDRANYLKYADSASDFFGNYLERGIDYLLLNEPVWLLLNMALGGVFTPAMTVTLLSAVPAFIVALFALSFARDYKSFFLVAVILLSPQVIRSNVIQIRQGVAIAVFIAGAAIPSRPLRWLVWMVAPFIHSSFFLVLPVSAALETMTIIGLSVRLRLAIIVLVIALLCVAMVPVAELLGARQAVRVPRYGDEGIGLPSMLMWSGIFVLYAIQDRDFLQNNELGISMIVFFVASYFSYDAIARIFQATALFSLLSSVDLRRMWWWIFTFPFVTYVVVQYAVRLNEPAFGW